jgi:hypothetical protein
VATPEPRPGPTQQSDPPQAGPPEQPTEFLGVSGARCLPTKYPYCSIATPHPGSGDFLVEVGGQLAGKVGEAVRGGDPPAGSVGTPELPAGPRLGHLADVVVRRLDPPTQT